MGRVIAVANQKGGVGKTTSTFNIAAALTRKGSHVLAIDMDPQAHLTKAMGLVPEKLDNTIADLLDAEIRLYPVDRDDIYEMIRKNANASIDLLPANIELSSIDVAIVTATAREYLLKEIIRLVRDDYDYILIDCLPSLGMLAINALTAADSVVVPTKAQYLDANGFALLRNTIALVQRMTNHDLVIDGVFMTMFDGRLKEAQATLNDTVQMCYGEGVLLFDTKISTSTDAATASRKGKSIFDYKPHCKVALEYENLTEEIINGHK